MTLLLLTQRYVLNYILLVRPKFLLIYVEIDEQITNILDKSCMLDMWFYIARDIA